MTAPPLRLLSVFECAARHRSLSRAAQTLNVTQPAVSKALRELETAVGTALFDRRNRPLTLTPAGDLLLAAARDALGRIDAALAEIAAMQGAADRTLSVSCSIGFATHWLMARLSAFGAAHDDIAISVITTPHDITPPGAPVDVRFRYGHGRWKGALVLPLFAESVEPVASPAVAADLLAAPLETMPLIDVAVEDPSWLDWPGYFHEAGLSPCGRTALRFNTYVQAVQAALAGRGVMLGWRSITGDLVAEGRLAAVGLPRVAPRDAAYHMVLSEPVRPIAARLAEWLRADQKPMASPSLRGSEAPR